MAPLFVSFAGVIVVAVALAPAAAEAPFTLVRWDANDTGPVLAPGGCPGDCDEYGARDVWVYQAPNGTYIMHYDAAGPTAWLSSRAVSANAYNWTKEGPILQLGTPPAQDTASASYGTTYYDAPTGQWHMFYLGTPNTSPPPDRIPSFPYLTMKAYGGASAYGPWVKQYEVVPFRPVPGSEWQELDGGGDVLGVPR
jgi:hypothetical protein